jgi:hypothetical protein
MIEQALRRCIGAIGEQEEPVLAIGHRRADRRDRKPSHRPARPRQALPHQDGNIDVREIGTAHHLGPVDLVADFRWKRTPIRADEAPLGGERLPHRGTNAIHMDV